MGMALVCSWAGARWSVPAPCLDWVCAMPGLALGWAKLYPPPGRMLDAISAAHANECFTLETNFIGSERSEPSRAETDT